MVCRKLKLDRYSLTMLILSSNSVRSKADIEIVIVGDANSFANKASSLVAFVPENVNHTIHLLRLHTGRGVNAHNAKYWITDKNLNEV